MKVLIYKSIEYIQTLKKKINSIKNIKGDKVKNIASNLLYDDMVQNIASILIN